MSSPNQPEEGQQRERKRDKVRNFFRSLQHRGQSQSVDLSAGERGEGIPSEFDEAISAAVQAHSKMNVSRLPTSSVPDTSTAAVLAQDAEAFAAPLIDHLNNFVSLVDALSEIHPYAKMAAAIFTTVPKILIAQAQRDEALRSLLDAIIDTYTLVAKYSNAEDLDEDRRVLLRDLSLQTVECAYFIRDQASVQGYYKRAGKNIIAGASVNAQIAGYTNTFLDIRRRLTERGVLEIEFRVLSSLSTISDSIELLALSHIRGAGLNSAKVCLPGTRTHILDELSAWVNDVEGARVRFLLGLAGTGKSAIAHSLGFRFDALRRLGCFFAFSRDFQRDRHPESIIPTIAYSLASWNPDFKRSLTRTLRDRGGLADATDILTQWVELIVKPASRVTFVGPVLIIIDAFDESSAIDSSSRQLLLKRFTVDARSLPPNFRVLLTSRPERDITNILAESSRDRAVELFHLDHSSIHTKQDVEAYVRSVLLTDSYYQEELDDARIRLIVDNAGGLFQWAFLACRLIQDNPAGRSLQERFDSRFESIAQSSSSLDQLYAEMLLQIFPTSDAVVIARFRSVMAQVMCASQPMSLDVLQRIRSYASISNDGDTSLVVPYMGAFLSGIGGQDPIRPLHTSFRDFLLDPDKSGIWHVSLSDGHFIMCQGLLTILSQRLRFNICDLRTSYAPNPELANLPQEVLVPELVYAASYLKDHILSLSGNLPLTSKDTILSLLHEVLCGKLLFWLELLSVMRRINTATAILQQAVLLFSDAGHANTQSTLRDAIAFVRRFSLPISRSAPHIYVSALPFSPTASITKNTFLSTFPRVPHVSGISAHWSHMLAAFPVNTEVYAVAWSSNGRYIAAGALSSSVHIWDVNSGELIGGRPLRAHSGSVNMIAFSPNGQHLVSGSTDSTLRIWDAATAEVVGNPLHGHTRKVEAVAYLPDGLRIISGSWDRTVRVWDATTGNPIGEPLCGHTDAVLSVAPSPDGLTFASSSHDDTVRIWDAVTWETIRVIRGHTDSVWSVAYSPDGCRVASGSADASIRIWDAQTGEAIGEPLCGHPSSVWSVVYSPSGNYIASSSNDTTICVWNADAIETNPVRVLRGHFDPVYSAVYAPDGQQILSCSADGTVRLWSTSIIPAGGEDSSSHPSSADAAVNEVTFSRDGRYVVSASSDLSLHIWDAVTGDQLREPLSGHTGTVYSVTCSSDYGLIASSSHDKTIRIWDATTGEAIGEPLRGHTDPIYSIAFAPDGRRLASASWDETVRIWDTNTGSSVGSPLRGHSDRLNAVAYSPDGNYIVSSSADTTIRTWDAQTGEAAGSPLRGHTGSVRSATYSPDGRRIVSASTDLTLRIWDTATGEGIGKPLWGHTDVIYSVVCTLDGRYIISGASDCTLRMWDMATGTAIGRFISGHSDVVWSLSLSPNGRHVASASNDGTVRIWDIGTMSSISAENSSPRTSEGLALDVVVGSSEHPRYDNRSDETKAMEGTGSQKVSSKGILVQDTSNRQPLLDFKRSSSTTSMKSEALQLDWKDGWIVDAAGHLLIWVPDEYRNSLSWPGTRVICGGYKPRVTIDFGGAAHGPEWMECVGETGSSSILQSR